MQSSESSHKDNFFVSYSHPDRAWAEWIAWQLEDGGYTTILQAWDFRAGSNWALNMRKATQQSERMIAVLSPDYLKSENAQAEWAAAFASDPAGLERKIIPIRVRPVDLTGLDRTIVYIDLVDQDEPTARAILGNELREGRLKPAHAPPFPLKAMKASPMGIVVPLPAGPRFPVTQLALESEDGTSDSGTHVRAVAFETPAVLSGELPARIDISLEALAAPLRLFLNFDQETFGIDARPADPQVSVTEKSPDHRFEMSFSQPGRYALGFDIRATKIENANGRLGMVLETHDNIEIKSEKRWINIQARQRSDSAIAEFIAWSIQHKLIACVAIAVGVLTMATLVIALLSRIGTPDPIFEAFRNGRSRAKSSTKATGNSTVGVTLWKMRRATMSDSGVVKFRGLLHPETSDDNAEWIPERVSLDSPINAGQFVRLSIESARQGYLYVIDRDIYADGSSSPPNLVFPTLRLRGGVNWVQPGAVAEIPDGQDRPPAFQLVKTRPDQVSILLTIIVAPQAISEIHMAPGRQQLKVEQVTSWEKRWGSRMERMENSASAGKAYTPSEQAAAQVDSHPLGPNDPLPMTLIRSKADAGQPMLVSVPINVQ